MTRARRAVATLLWIVTCISCGSGGDRGDETGRSESAIINGTAITDTAEVEARKVVYIRAIQIQGGKPIDCVRGSGTLLTNDWILTAAHVMDPDPEGLIKKGCSVPVKLSEYKIFLGDPAKSAQSRDPNVVAFHPRWRGWPNPPTDTDVALVHVSSPFLLGGSTTGHQRPITDLDTSSLNLKSTYCYGYGRSDLCQVGGPPLRWAPFTVQPFPAPFPYTTLPSHSYAFTVMKGGGIAHDDSGTGIILYSGDSGGPCIDPTGTIAGKEPVWGVLSSVDPTRPISCGTQPPANDPRFAVIVAAQAFRDWARSVLATNTPKVSFDIDLDTTPDEFAIKQIGANLYIEVKLSTLDTPVYLPPGGVPPLSGTGADRALIQHGDFNKNSVQDLFALINGIPIYVPGSAGVDLSNPPTTSLSLSSSYEYVTPARAPDDANKDGIDDLIATRSDGRQDIYLGNSSKGLTTAAYLYPRGFRFFDAADPQESFAVAAPSFSPRLDWAGGLKPSKGVVYLVSTDSAAKVWVDAFTLDKAAGFAAEDGDAFGQALAWGDFDKDTSRLAEIVIGAPGKTVNGVKRAGVVAWLGFSNNANFMYVLDRSSMGNSQAPAENDEFGHDLAVGDFDADDDDDLAIGQAGAVHVLKGTGTSGTGAPLTPQKTVDASTFGIGTTSLGYALTTGDFNCDGYEDLAIGIEGASVQGLTQAGTVVVSYGSSAGLNFPAAGSGGSWQKIDKTMNIEGGPPHAYDHFGYVLAAGNFNGDSYNGRPCTDLAIASEPLGQYTLEGTKFVFVGHVGAVHVIRGGPSGLSAVGSQRLEQGSMAGATPISDLAEFRDHFGGALAVTAADTDGFDDLIVGAWGEDDAAGAAHILRGSSQGIVATGQAVWRQDQLVPVQDKAAGDNFGATVGGTSNGLVLLSAPGESFAGATAGDPQIRQAGWVAAIRLSGSSPISYSGLAALTEPALSGKTPLREAGFLGRAVTAARPAFVPVQDAQVRFTGVIISDSGARLGDRCDGDVTPPVIDAIELSPGCIWPPNKKLVAYRLRDNLVVSATDNCDVSPEVRVKSVVVVDSKVKPSPGPAYLFGDNGFCLRADRGGDGSRTYLISIEARDSQGNSSVATASVTVPASLGAPATCAALAPASFTSEIDVRCQF